MRNKFWIIIWYKYHDQIGSKCVNRMRKKEKVFHVFQRILMQIFDKYILRISSNVEFIFGEYKKCYI